MGRFGGWSGRLFPTTLPLNGTLEYSRGASEHQILNDCVFRFLVRWLLVACLLVARYGPTTFGWERCWSVPGNQQASNKQPTFWFDLTPPHFKSAYKSLSTNVWKFSWVTPTICQLFRSWQLSWSQKTDLWSYNLWSYNLSRSRPIW